MMRHSETHGADFVVLSMFFGILFAFFVAVVNWFLDKLDGIPFPIRDGATDNVS